MSLPPASFHTEEKQVGLHCRMLLVGGALGAKSATLEPGNSLKLDLSSLDVQRGKNGCLKAGEKLSIWSLNLSTS